MMRIPANRETLRLARKVRMLWTRRHRPAARAALRQRLHHYRFERDTWTRMFQAMRRGGCYVLRVTIGDAR